MPWLKHGLFVLLGLICLFPLIPGFIGVVSASFHYIPALNFNQFNAQGFADVFAWNGVYQSLLLSISTALFSTLLALFASFLILQKVWLTPKWQTIQVRLAPLLALPHVAFAIGFLLLLSPTGLLARGLNLFFDVNLTALVRDPLGLGLILSLTLKEIPFILLMSASVLQQIPVRQHQDMGASLGLSHPQVWWQVILPQWLPKMRFSVFAVLAYACSVVDMSLILSPSTPPPFAVLVWQWFNDGDLNLYPRAAAGAFVLFLVCIGLLWGYQSVEKFCLATDRSWRYTPKLWFIKAQPWIYRLVLWFSWFCIALLVVWSFAQRWRFPDLLPNQWALSFWQSEWPYLQQTLQISIVIALVSASISTLFAILAQEYRQKYPRRVPMLLIALPMLLPQLSLLFGIQVFILYLSGEHYLFWVTWSHIFFAFPYCYLALDGPWKSYPRGYDAIGASLGLSPIRVWFSIKLPQLLPSILTAWAIGMSVSLSQYLSTQMLGGGRISTLTTEAVALASGYDRRLMALYALWQAVIPLCFFMLAFAINRAYFSKFLPSHSPNHQKVPVVHELKTK